MSNYIAYIVQTKKDKFRVYCGQPINSTIGDNDTFIHVVASGPIFDDAGKAADFLRNEPPIENLKKTYFIPVPSSAMGTWLSQLEKFNPQG